MGAKKVGKYYCLIIILFFWGCISSIKSIDENNLKDRLIRVEVNNHTYEVGISHIFKAIMEDILIKRGATAVEFDEQFKIQINISDIKTKPLTFDKKDIANSYSLTIISYIRIYSINNNEEKLIKEFRLSPVYSYPVKGLTDAEIERQLAIQKAAFEISAIIYDYLIMLP